MAKYTTVIYGKILLSLTVPSFTNWTTQTFHTSEMAITVVCPHDKPQKLSQSTSKIIDLKVFNLNRALSFSGEGIAVLKQMHYHFRER